MTEPRFFGNKNAKPTNPLRINMKQTVDNSQLDRSILNVLDNSVNFGQFIDYCGQHYRSVELHYCKAKIDKLITRVQSNIKQVKKYVSTKIITMIKNYYSLIEVHHENKKDAFEKTKTYVSNKYNQITVSFTMKKFNKIYNKMYDYINSEDKMREQLSGEVFKYKIVNGYKTNFEKLSFKEAVKFTSDLYPLVSMSVSLSKVNSLIKSRDNYNAFINNPPIISSFEFVGTKKENIAYLLDLFTYYYRFYGRYELSYYLFENVDREFLTPAGFEIEKANKVWYTYVAFYGKTKASKKIEEDANNNLIDLNITTQTDDEGNIVEFKSYQFNENTPKALTDYKPNNYATGEGVGTAMFFKLFGEYTKSKLPTKQHYIRFIEINSSKGTIPEINNIMINYEKPMTWEEMREFPQIDQCSMNTQLSLEGKRIYAYYMQTHIGDTWRMDNQVTLHGFSSYNNHVAWIQTIPLSLDYFYTGHGKKSLLLYFSENELSNLVSVDPKAPIMQLGYFLKQLPEDAAKYNFNTEDNYFCPVTALTRQGGELGAIDDKMIRALYHDLGIFRRDDIRIYKNDLPSFYSQLSILLDINFIVNIYFINDEGKRTPTTYYFIGKEKFYCKQNNSKVGKEFKDLQRAKQVNDLVKRADGYNYAVILFRGHVFNADVHGSTAYIEKIAKIYDELNDAADIHMQMNKDLLTFRMEEEVKVKQNKGYLLRNLKSKKKTKKPKHSEIKSDSKKYTNDEQCMYFVYDYETNYREQMYQTVESNMKNVDQSEQSVEHGHITDLSDIIPYSNQSIRFNSKFEIVDSLFTYDLRPQSNLKSKLNWMINEHINPLDATLKKKLSIECFVYAHNGSGFDNIITMYDILKHIDMKLLNKNILKVLTPRKVEVAGRPLSFELGLILMTGRKVTISFRDSYRILSTPVKDFGSTFGLDVIKLAYPYDFYQKFNTKISKDQREKTFGKFNIKIENMSTPELSKYINTNDDECKKFQKYIYKSAHLSKLSYMDQLEHYRSFVSYCNTSEFKNCYIMWKKYGFNQSDVELMSSTGKYVQPSWFARSHEDDGLSCEFILHCAYLSCKNFDKITKNQHMIDSLTKYVDKIGKDCMFHVIKYCEVYNYYDCYNVVMALGRFQKKINELSQIKKVVKLHIDGRDREIHVDLSKVSEINILQFRSISSISWQVAVLSGCLDGVEKLNGSLQYFISCDKRGGKCFVNRKRMHFKSTHYDEIVKYIGQEVTNENIVEVLGHLTAEGGSVQDNDFCSMYLSAMTLMGVPTGYPTQITDKKVLKVLLNAHLPFWVACSWESKYVMDMPESCKKTDDGKNMWTNGKFENQVIDDVKMRYMMETGELTFDDFKFQNGVIGCYFNDCNYMIAGMMSVMFDERNAVKNEDTPGYNPGLSAVLKLVCNTIFGSSILKEKESRSRYVENTRLLSTIAKNRCKLEKNFTTCGNYSEIKEFSNPSLHKIYPQYGARVLSVSKVMHGEQIFAQSNIRQKKQYISQHPDFKLPTTLSELCKWTVSLADLDSEGRPIIEWYGCYTDTDSFASYVDCTPFIKPYIGKKLRQLHSDFEFKDLKPICYSVDKNTSVKYPELIDLANNMKLSAIEAYYCSPKSYACNVFGIEVVDGVKRYAIREHVRLKGVYKGMPTFDDLKRLYNGEPLKYISQSTTRFIHKRGSGLGCQTDVHAKEIIPDRVNFLKYYYAEGESILSGHYKLGEKPIVRHNFLKYCTNKKIRYFNYKPDGIQQEYCGNSYENLIRYDQLQLKLTR